MSEAQKKKARIFLGVGFDKLTQAAITIMTAVILFMGKEVYYGTKQLIADSNQDKQEHAVQRKVNDDFDRRLTKLEQK